MTKVGFIGLGIMGAPMAANLQAGGCKLFLHDHKNPPATLIEGGATACTSGAEVAKRADIIIIMVPDTPHVEAVLFGADGVAAGLVDRQDRGRHELDLADRDQGLRQANQRARLRLPRCAGVGRRSRRARRRR